MQMRHQRALVAMAGKLEVIVFQMLSGLSKLRMSASEPRAFARWSRHFSVRKEATYRIRRIAAGQQVLTAFFRTDKLPVGKECVRTCRFRWARSHYIKTKNH